MVEWKPRILPLRWLKAIQRTKPSWDTRQDGDWGGVCEACRPDFRTAM